MGFDGTVRDMLRIHARFDPSENVAGFGVKFLFVENVAPGASFNRFNPMTGTVRCGIGSLGCPDLDTQVKDLEAGDGAVVAKMLLAIEHEKRHAFQYCNLFQDRNPSDMTVRMARDFMAAVQNPTWRDVAYGYDMAELDAGHHGILNGFAVIASVFGEQFAEATVCAAYDSSSFENMTGRTFGGRITAEPGPFRTIGQLTGSVAERRRAASYIGAYNGLHEMMGHHDLLGRVLAKDDDGRLSSALRHAVDNDTQVDLVADITCRACSEYALSLPSIAAFSETCGFDEAFGATVGAAAVYIGEMGTRAEEKFHETANVQQRNGHRLNVWMARKPLIGRCFVEEPDFGWLLDDSTRKLYKRHDGIV